LTIVISARAVRAVLSGLLPTDLKGDAMSPSRMLAIAAMFPIAVSAADLSNQDRDYLRDRARMLTADVQAGQLASTKATSDHVRAFAFRMVNDHQRALENVRKLAAARQVDLAAEPSGRDERQMKKLNDLAGLEFDKEYMERAIRTHRDGTKADRKRMYGTKDTELRALASASHDLESAHFALANRTFGSIPVK
jgi:putative membrane protein